MILHVALDRRTGFPCVRLEKSGSYVSVFPITKPQVEQWIKERKPFDANTVTDVSYRLEECFSLKKGPDGTPVYPESVKLLDRRPISELNRETALSLVATNLTLWSRDQSPSRGMEFPTPQSEWGRMLAWVHGFVRDFQTWESVRDLMQKIRTRDLLMEILDQDFEFAPTVRGVLGKMLDVFSNEQRGLPFMSMGVYELVSDTKKFPISDQREGTVDIVRPLVAGESEAWPVMNGDGNSKWRAVFKEDLPVVGVRTWYKPEAIKEAESNGRPRIVSIEERPNPPCPERPTRLATRRASSLKRAVQQDDVRIKICSECCREIETELVDENKGLLCYTEKTKLLDGQSDLSKENNDGEPSINRHASRIPEGTAVITQVSVNARYLHLLLKHLEKIHSVTLSGFTKGGKTTWLLSLTGMAVYPAGDSILTNIFPNEWNFWMEFYNMENPVTDKLKKAREDMWVYGDLPLRTSAMEKALHSPICFKTRRNGPFGPQEKSMVLIFNDIAGEVIIDPTRLANDKYYPHVCATKDVIFIHPASQVETANDYLAQFVKGLSIAQRNGRNLDPRKINLVFGFSKIDRLKYLTGKYGALFDIFTHNHYRLPGRGSNSEAEIKLYLEGMANVHFDLVRWIRDNFRDLYTTATENFGSVRWCGFSSFGFELVNEGKKDGTEACLPFEPHPVRVVDPLLWLLQNTGVI